jgi:glutamate/aspartate transport system substrate-binding protein
MAVHYTYWIGRGLLAWLACGAMAGPALGQAALERIKQRGQVTLGYRDDAPPFSFAHAGRPAGYTLDLCLPMAARLAQQAGLPATALRFLAVPVDQRERFVKGGNVDLLCGAMSDTVERRASVDFSPPIFVTAVKVLVRKKDKFTAMAQLGGKPITVIDRTTAGPAVAGYAKQKGLAFTVDKSVGPDAALGQLKLGWVAGYARDDVLLAMQLATLPDRADYLLLPEALSSENIAIAFAKDDVALQKLVTQVLVEQRTSGAWAASYERWFMQPIGPAKVALNIPMSDALKASITKLQ